MTWEPFDAVESIGEPADLVAVVTLPGSTVLEPAWSTADQAAFLGCPHCGQCAQCVHCPQKRSSAEPC